MKPLQRVRLAFKAAASAIGVVFSGWGGGSYGWGSSWSWTSRLPNTNIDYASAVGDGRGSSIIQACVLWMSRAYPEAPLRVQKKAADGMLETVENHPMVELLASPNPYYSGVLLWMALLGDWMLSGNAYLWKIRSGAGIPVQLFWIPSTLIEPTWPDDGSAYISGYLYRPDGKQITIAPDDIVHLRYGLDPNNIRKGLSPLASLFREIFTDDEAANFSASLLRNMGVPGLVLSPKGESSINPQDAEDLKLKVKQKFSGDNRGEPLVMFDPTDVQVLGFNPQQMSLKDVRRIPEERVSAIFGTPAVVVGLGAGLDRSTFANFAEAREAAYESNIIPTQRLMAAELTSQLLPDFSDPKLFVIDHDLSKVRVLQVDENALHERIRGDVLAGLLTVNQGREKIGEDQMDGCDVFYIPSTVIPTDPADLLMMAQASPEPAPTAMLPVADPLLALTAPKNGRANGVAARVLA